MEEITLAGFHGWLKREKNIVNASQTDLHRYYPLYVEHVRAKRSN